MAKEQFASVSADYETARIRISWIILVQVPGIETCFPIAHLARNVWSLDLNYQDWEAMHPDRIVRVISSGFLCRFV
jgi:hypothetical protein